MLYPGYLSEETSEAPEHINACVNFLCPSMLSMSCILLCFQHPVVLLMEISDGNPWKDTDRLLVQKVTLRISSVCTACIGKSMMIWILIDM